MLSMARASEPISTRRLLPFTPLRMVWEASSGVVRNIFSKSRRALSTSPVIFSTPAPMRALRAILVLMPPGCTEVQDTRPPSISSSWRRASVKPRTANLDAL